MATLKISDLSVGDWVRYKGEECTTASIYMAAEGYPSEVALTHQGICCGCAYIDYLEPIPITPEILEANGWEKVSKVVYKWSNEKHRVFCWLNGFSHFVDVEEMDKQFVTKSSRIEVSQLYVHQLQHALRLAGVEKEIVMPNK